MRAEIGSAPSSTSVIDILVDTDYHLPKSATVHSVVAKVDPSQQHNVE